MRFDQNCQHAMVQLCSHIGCVRMAVAEVVVVMAMMVVVVVGMVEGVKRNPDQQL